MTDYKKYINALRKCANEHENDRTSTGHIIVSDLCRDTANLLEELEQEPVLDKVRAEIGKSKTEHEMQIAERDIKAKLLISNIYCDIDNIINKYKGESEGKHD